MFRASGLVLLLLASSAFAEKPTAQQIRDAITDLGSKNYNTREKAAKLLWDAGTDSEEALRVAANSQDAETSHRARTILDKFDCGTSRNSPTAKEREH